MTMFLGKNVYWEKIIGKDLFQRIRTAFLFRPTDYLNLWQMPPPRIPDDEVSRIQGFRYPAPGSRSGARIPVRESPDEVFDIQHYSRDSRNLPRDDQMFINSAARPTLIEAIIPKIGSPGQKNPAVLSYDPTGLRTTMTTTWAALDKALVEKAKPNHLVTPSWEKDLESIWKECDEKGIPRVPGRRQYAAAPADYNELRW